MSELSGVQAVASENEAGVFDLSADTLALLSFALGFVEDYENWKDYPDEVLSDADIDAIDRLVGVATYEVMNMAKGIFIGQIALKATLNPMAGWLACDGSAVSRADYADLFAEIGTDFGPGDGSTTFNLPNLIDRIPMGSGGAVVPDAGDTAGSLTHTLTTAQIPAHSHTINDPGHTHTIEHTNSVVGGATMRWSGNTTGQLNPNGPTLSNTTGISINNAGGGGSHPILNPVTGVGFFIYTGV